MKKVLKNIVIAAVSVVTSAFICIGYAAISDNLSIAGDVELSPPPKPDVYITSVTPDSSAGVKVNNTTGTVMFATVTGGGNATFTIDVINISNTTYVFDRVIDGSELSFDGVYSGPEITYELIGIN